MIKILEKKLNIDTVSLVFKIFGRLFSVDRKDQTIFFAFSQVDYARSNKYKVSTKLGAGYNVGIVIIK